MVIRSSSSCTVLQVIGEVEVEVEMNSHKLGSLSHSFSLNPDSAQSKHLPLIRRKDH